MNDWKSRIRQIIQGHEAPEGAPDNVQEAKNQISEFINDVVMPAFEELKSEIDQLADRTAEIRKTDIQASITVFRDAIEEFFFAIRGRFYHQTTAGFPQITRDDFPMVCKAEIVLYSGSQGQHPLEDWNSVAIIESFVREYEKWGRWGPASKKSDPIVPPE